MLWRHDHMGHGNHAVSHNLMGHAVGRNLMGHAVGSTEWRADIDACGRY